MTLDLGIEPGPHWLEASALTTAPSLHPWLGLRVRFRVSTTIHGLINISTENNKDLAIYESVSFERVSGAFLR